MSTCKLLPIGALALAFTFAPAQAAPVAPTTSFAGKAEASVVTPAQWGIAATPITGVAGDRARGSDWVPGS